MGRNRNKNKNSYKNTNQVQLDRGRVWFDHYYNYLSQLTFQLFEWENLPESVDPRYLEMSIHLYGHVGFFKDKNLGWMVCQGAMSGTINHYLRPTHFHAVAPNYQNTFKVLNYSDSIKSGKDCIIIHNNDMRLPSMNAIKMFSQDLTELKEIIHVNQNAQKTPVLIVADDGDLFTYKNFYSNYEGNAPVIMVHKDFDIDRIKVHKTDAPFVVDKLNTQRNAVWNELMTYLGIKNTNVDKQERALTNEIDSNNEQIEASGNIFLKARQEACDMINEHFGLDLKVKFRTEALEEFNAQSIIQSEQSPMSGGGRIE